MLANKGLSSQRGNPLQAAGLWRMLTNSTYIGLVPWNGISTSGKHVPLVTEQTFREVQLRLGERYHGGIKAKPALRV